MTSITTLLLQAAISLLLLVQGNPNVDPALREQAIRVANQAIKTATAERSAVVRPTSVPTSFPLPIPSTRDDTRPHNVPIIESVNGKGGFGVGNDNYILGRNFTTAQTVYLKSVHLQTEQNDNNIKIFLSSILINDTRMNIFVPDSVIRGTYNLYVENQFGTSAPYYVGDIGTNRDSLSVDLKVKDPYNTAHSYNWTDAYVDEPIAIDSGATVSLKWTVTEDNATCTVSQNGKYIAWGKSDTMTTAPITTDTTFILECSNYKRTLMNKDSVQVNIKG
jgi:hypothetical protein